MSRVAGRGGGAHHDVAVYRRGVAGWAAQGAQILQSWGGARVEEEGMNGRVAKKADHVLAAHRGRLTEPAGAAEIRRRHRG